VDYFRKAKRSNVIYSDNKDIFEILNVNQESADTRLVQNQSHERIRKMLNQLPEEQREVIVLRHYADMSFKEIAEITETSINTALGRMRYGLINLRKILVENQMSL